jgi:AcrR family transcriptional regulator
MSTRIARDASPMRKAPRQARSRATVAAIVEAGARILGYLGWSAFTTNKVAERAGVSIGSLYQYFPDKRSLVDAIRQRHLDDCLAAVSSLPGPALSATAFACEIVHRMIAVHAVHPGLHRVLLDEAPRSVDHSDPRSDFEQLYLERHAEALASLDGHPPDDADRHAATILSDAIDGVIHNAVRRGTLHDAGVERELVRLVGAYLAQRGEARRGRDDTKSR